MAAAPCPLLPDDAIREIFARLPAKAVHRCRCLSRAWGATLASDEFADRHGSPRILILQGANSRDESAKVQVWSPLNPGSTTLMQALPHDNVLITENLITQQCRGLLMLKGYDARTLYVLNPSTDRMAALPATPWRRPTGCVGATFLGLGYDKRSRKHKVVRAYFNSYSPEKLLEYAGCEVYEINTTGHWRSANGCARENPPDLCERSEAYVFAQGHLHWFASRELPSRLLEEFILSFNLDDEMFGAVSFPPLAMENNYHQLAEFDGRLCLFGSEVPHNTWARRHDVWLLSGHDTAKWVLHCRINLDLVPTKVAGFMRFTDWIIPFAIIDVGRRIVLIRQQITLPKSSFQLCAYDLVTGDMENLLEGSGLFCDNSIVWFRNAELYEESVVSPIQPLAL